MKNIFLTASLLVLTVACANKPKVVQYSPDTNVEQATSQLGRELESAKIQQMDIVAPDSFAAAEKHLQKSKSIQSQDNFKNENALEELGTAQAYFDQAKGAYSISAPLLNEVIEARQAALKAGVTRNRKNDLNDIDADFRVLSRNAEQGNTNVDLKEKSNLQKRYLDLELSVIKSEKLAYAQGLMKQAKELHADKIAPKAWASAESKMSNAEAVITSDRHDEAAINDAVSLAESEAKRAYALTRIARSAKSKTSEDVASDIYQKNGEISYLGRRISEGETQEQTTAAALAAKNQELAQAETASAAALSGKEQELAQAKDRQNSLESEQRFNQTLQDAQKKLNPHDALVYRQGNDLVVRLKSVNFDSGKADLPSHAIPILGQTKQLILDLNAQKVVVEGHTDAVGSHDVNMRISKERADTVAKYLSADNAISPSHIETRGMGDEQPLTTNKTGMGRAENRRVDIVITPNPIN